MTWEKEEEEGVEYVCLIFRVSFFIPAFSWYLTKQKQLF